MNVWEEVKERVLIEEVIGEYIPVYPAGRNFRCLSPFRQEKTPSLIISPDKRIWHDFGSGEGGDVFEFVSRIENITRFEALKKLAQKVGVTVKTSKSSQQNETAETLGDATQGESVVVTDYDRGLTLLDWSSGIYHKVLLRILQSRSNPITEYCIERGLSQEIVETFKLGYAPKDGFLMSLATQHNVDLNLLYEVGLLKKVDQENRKPDDKPLYKDKFSDRLMIPIRNAAGKVVGFTGRVLPYDKIDRPKYLNSPQTDWFNKSRIWYGFDLNRRNLVHSRTAMIVEGNMDVIAAYRFGLKYALASQGTSFTTDQLKILKSYVDTLWLAFDNDDAGQIAGKKLFTEATKLGFISKKVVIPEEHKDIDEYLTALSRAIEPDKISGSLEVVNYIDWQISKKSSLLAGDDLEAQRNAVMEILELLAITDSITIEQYTAKLAKITGFNRSKLSGEVDKLQQNAKPGFTKAAESEPSKPPVSLPNPNTEILQSWQSLASYYLFYPDGKLTEENMTNVFNLLKEFFSKLAVYETLNEYLEANQPMLELIWENKQPDANAGYIATLQKGISLFFDQKVETFLFDQNKYLLYSKIKGFTV